MTASTTYLLRQLDAPLRPSTIVWTCSALLAGFVGLSALSYGSAAGSVLPSGEPVGQDFSAFYTVSRLISAGTPELAYDVAASAEAFRQVVPASRAEYLWQYAPPTHLLVWPLAGIPFAIAAVLWTAVAVLAFATMASVLARRRLAVLAAVSSPALLWDVWHHQLGALVAALLAFGLFQSAVRPGLAGLAIGALIIKPHFAVLTPLMFLVARAWKAIVAATLTVGVLVAVSWFVMGEATWTAFLEAVPRSGIALEEHMFAERLMTSPFSAVRVAGGPLWLAYVSQAAAALAAGGACLLVWRRSEDPHLRTAAGLAAAGLITPYLFVYDGCLAALAIAALAGHRGRLPQGSIGLLTIAWFLPLPAHALSFLYGFQVGWAPSAIVLSLALAASWRPENGLQHA